MASQQSRLDFQGPLGLLKPLRAEIGGRRAVLRYLSARAGHPGAVLLREERGSLRQQSLDALGLTAREAEIVGYVIRGESNATVGDKLRVAPATVKKHRDNVYAKLGVRGRGRLAVFVFDARER
jgi:DNA-binding CsgD family transcriptional regulator